MISTCKRVFIGKLISGDWGGRGLHADVLAPSEQTGSEGVQLTRSLGLYSGRLSFPVAQTQKSSN